MFFSLPMFYITAWTTYGPNQRRDHRSPQAADMRPSLSPRLGCGDHAENMCRPCDGPSLEDTDGSAFTVGEGRVTAGYLQQTERRI